jgi:hypothetical protein
VIVYHGSYTKIDQVDLSRCRPHRDFGRGFYVTKFSHHAESLANIMGRRYKTKGVVSEFEYYESAFTQSICKIKHFDKYDEEWLDFVVMNRSEDNLEPAHAYDIVEGPVADDKIQNRINDYVSGKIGKDEFLEDLKWHEETHQICFCTVVSLQTLKHTGYRKQISLFAHIGEPIVEKLVTDFGLDEQAAGDKFFSSDVFSKLAGTETELYKADWKEIYQLLLCELKLEGSKQEK